LECGNSLPLFVFGGDLSRNGTGSLYRSPKSGDESPHSKTAPQQF